MKSGRELDFLVAEKIFGFETKPSPNSFTQQNLVIPKHYSTEKNTALEIKDKIYELGLGDKFIENLHSYVAIRVDWDDKNRKNSDIWESITPLDICVAALKAKGVDVNEWEKAD